MKPSSIVATRTREALLAEERMLLGAIKEALSERRFVEEGDGGKCCDIEPAMPRLSR